MIERIYSLRLDIKSPDLPFVVKKSICCESGDLIQVFARFQLELIQLLKSLKEEDERHHLIDDDIPF